MRNPVDCSSAETIPIAARFVFANFRRFSADFLKQVRILEKFLQATRHAHPRYKVATCQHGKAGDRLGGLR